VEGKRQEENRGCARRRGGEESGEFNIIIQRELQNFRQIVNSKRSASPSFNRTFGIGTTISQLDGNQADIAPIVEECVK